MGEQTIAASATPDSTTPNAGACAMVIFGGGGGDLTKRLVVPALYNLTTTGLLPDDFAIIGVDRSDDREHDGSAEAIERYMLRT